MTEPSYEELKARLADLENRSKRRRKPESSIFA